MKKTMPAKGGSYSGGKIAILSDSHDNWVNLEKTINYLNKQKITLLIHCGDVCAPETLEAMIKMFKGKELHLVNGNADADIEGFDELARKYKKLKYHGNTGKIDTDGLTMVFCHFPLVAKKMAQSGKYDLVFHGHTHTPWQEKIDDTEILNPGTVAGLFSKATFALLDTETKNPQLIFIDNL